MTMFKRNLSPAVPLLPDRSPLSKTIRRRRTGLVEPIETRSLPLVPFAYALRTIRNGGFTVFRHAQFAKIYQELNRNAIPGRRVGVPQLLRNKRL